MTLSLPAPAYTRGSIADVVPALAGMLGASEGVDPAALARVPGGLPGEARAAVVVLIDGLGLELLRARAAHAPFLRSQLPGIGTLTAGFPSTTANSLSSLGTGLLPGAHGVVGYRLRDPERDLVFNQLTWDSTTDPLAWVPDTTMFERLAASGVDVVSLGEAKFAGRGLNLSSLRGGRFRPSRTLAERAEHALAELRAPGRRLVYLYWGELDKRGHVHGAGSWEWLEELERIDLQLRGIADRLPAGTAMVVTADHGMVDTDHETRFDVALEPALRAGVADLGGEPRAVHVYARPGAGPEVLAAWRETLGDRAMVITRDAAIAAGYFGPVAPRNRERIGDVVAVATGDFSIVDSARDSASALALIGHHGGLSDAELLVPFLALRN